METWRPVVGYEGLYEVSDAGRVRGIRRHLIHQEVRGKAARKYSRVALWRENNDRKVFVHVLVAQAFIGECPAGYQHNHKDGDKSNNRPSNIEFVTASQNQRHRFDVLGQTQNVGAAHGMSKLTDTDVIAIRARHGRGELQRVIAKDFNIERNTVGAIVRGTRWKHLLPAHCQPVK